MVSVDDVINVLKNVYDPEIPFNIVDLGLIYDVKIRDRSVYIKMTLTTPGCPLSNYLIERVREAVLSLNDVDDVKIELTWDPPWSPDMIKPELKKKLGIE